MELATTGLSPSADWESNAPRKDQKNKRLKFKPILKGQEGRFPQHKYSIGTN